MEARLADPRTHLDLLWWVREREQNMVRDILERNEDEQWQIFVCYENNKSVGFRGIRLYPSTTWPGYTYSTGIVGAWSPRVGLKMVETVEKMLPSTCIFSKWTCDLDNYKSLRLARTAGYTEKAFQDFWFWEKELRYRPAHNFGKWFPVRRS